jgi:hypothetical protein
MYGTLPSRTSDSSSRCELKRVWCWRRPQGSLPELLRWLYPNVGQVLPGARVRLGRITRPQPLGPAALMQNPTSERLVSKQRSHLAWMW